MRLPDETQRLTIIGRTGSGKTQAGMWFLSLAPFDRMPFIIVDFKRSGLIGELGAIELRLDEYPEEPGLYVVHPMPSEDDYERLEALFWNVWRRGHCGLFIDETYLVPSGSDAFNALLTQGREKHIPMLMCTQRPVWLSRFVFSESDFFQIFHLVDRKDRITVEGFVPVDLERRLPEYWSYYYDVARNEVTRLRPVPPRPVLLAAIHARLSAMRQPVLAPDDEQPYVASTKTLHLL